MYSLEDKGLKRFFGKKIDFFNVISKYRYFCRNVYILADKRQHDFLAKNIFFSGDFKISLFSPKCVYLAR